MNQALIVKPEIEWPPNYTAVFKERQQRLLKIKEKRMESHAFEYYRDNPIDFIEHWCVTYDPRNAASDVPTTMPFVLFPRQKEYVQFLIDLVDDQENGLVEKTRDMGATWVSCAFSLWLFLFREGSAVGWGSRKELLVDRLGDPDSIFEKIRIMIRALPRFLVPGGLVESVHLSYMNIKNPSNGSTITGEAGKNIGRGGRKLIYFKDESAHYEQAEKIEAALGDNTNCQVDISSVLGSGNIFYRKRKNGTVRVFIMDWKHHPAKTQEWYDKRKEHAIENGLEHIFAQEIDRDYHASIEGVIIPAKYVKAAIDAHLKLNFKPSGRKTCGLDVADEGFDKNALVTTHGVVVIDIEKWGQGDTTVTAQRAYSYAHSVKADRLIYDKIGVGAGVKGETNRLKKTDKYKDCKVEVSGFNAASKKLYKPNQEFMPGMKNKEMFCNIKAQMWWIARQRFVNTYNAINKGKKFPPEQLISISSDVELYEDLVLELSQPKEARDGEGKIKVESKKDSTFDSQNLADAFIESILPHDFSTEREVRAIIIN